MAKYIVTISNISANVGGMTVPQGEKREFTVNASDFAEACAKGVKRAFGEDAHFTHNSGYGEVGFSTGNGLNLYGKIHADYREVSADA